MQSCMKTTIAGFGIDVPDDIDKSTKILCFFLNINGIRPVEHGI